jgi:hypothetical protein
MKGYRMKLTTIDSIGFTRNVVSKAFLSGMTEQVLELYDLRYRWYFAGAGETGVQNFSLEGAINDVLGRMN